MAGIDDVNRHPVLHTLVLQARRGCLDLISNHGNADLVRAGRKSDLPPGVPGGGGTMRAQWANWKKLSPMFGSEDLIWTDALSRVVVCWRPSSRIGPGPVPRIDKLWSRCYRRTVRTTTFFGCVSFDDTLP